MFALCCASGEIHFEAKVPRDLSKLPIANGPEKELRRFISGVARHGYDGETLLVPGVPEAANENAALEALLRFRDWITPGAAKAGLDV